MRNWLWQSRHRREVRQGGMRFGCVLATGLIALSAASMEAAAQVLAGPSPRPAVQVQPAVPPAVTAPQKSPPPAPAEAPAKPANTTAAKTEVALPASPAASTDTDGVTGNSAVTIHAAAPETVRPEKPREIATELQPAATGPTTAPASPTTAPSTRPAMATAASGIAPSELERSEIRRGPAAAAAPGAAKTEAASQTSEITRVVGALAAVVGLIFILRWGSRKLMALPADAGNSHLMQVVGRTALSPRQQMLLVKVGNRLLVVGDSGGQLTSLAQIDDADEIAGVLGKVRTPGSTEPASPAFSTLYRKIAAKFGRAEADDAGNAENGWTDASDTVHPTERNSLLTGLDSSETAEKDLQSPARDKPEVGFSEDEAEAAVSAARKDIQALRAKLQQVTRRLTDDDSTDDSAPPRRGGVEPS